MKPDVKCPKCRHGYTLSSVMRDEIDGDIFCVWCLEFVKGDKDVSDALPEPVALVQFHSDDMPTFAEVHSLHRKDDPHMRVTAKRNPQSPDESPEWIVRCRNRLISFDGEPPTVKSLVSLGLECGLFEPEEYIGTWVKARGTDVFQIDIDGKLRYTGFAYAELKTHMDIIETSANYREEVLGTRGITKNPKNKQLIPSRLHEYDLPEEPSEPPIRMTAEQYNRIRSTLTGISGDARFSFSDLEPNANLCGIPVELTDGKETT